MRGTLKRITEALHSQEGVGLIEALIATAIVGVALTAFVTTLSTSSFAVSTTSEQVTAANLARSQMEYTKSQAYVTAPTSYDTITPPSEDYSISAMSSPLPEADDNIQKVVVNISHHGEVVFTLEDLKVNR